MAAAKIIIEARVPSQTTVELCATEAAVLLNAADTIAVFGSNQTAVEGVVADGNLYVCGTGDSDIIAVASTRCDPEGHQGRRHVWCCTGPRTRPRDHRFRPSPLGRNRRRHRHRRVLHAENIDNEEIARTVD